MGVNFYQGPSIDELIAASPRTSSPTRASIARLVMDIDAFEDYPWGRVAFKFLMSR
ncbi:unnamed protein product [Brassica rapa subsp. trilocularis]